MPRALPNVCSRCLEKQGWLCPCSGSLRYIKHTQRWKTMRGWENKKVCAWEKDHVAHASSNYAQTGLRAGLMPRGCQVCELCGCAPFQSGSLYVDTWSSDLRWSDNRKAGVERGTELKSSRCNWSSPGFPAFSCDSPKATDIKMLQSCSKRDFHRMFRCEGPANEDCPHWSKESSPWLCLWMWSLAHRPQLQAASFLLLWW